MASLFRKDEKFTNLGLKVHDDIAKSISDIFKNNTSVSVRELAAIAHLVVCEIECETILENNHLSDQNRKANSQTEG